MLSPFRFVSFLLCLLFSLVSLHWFVLVNFVSFSFSLVSVCLVSFHFFFLLFSLGGRWFHWCVIQRTVPGAVQAGGVDEAGASGGRGAAPGDRSGEEARGPDQRRAGQSGG